MGDPVQHSRVVRFGVFEADFRCGQLRKQGIRIKVQDQPMQVLEVLLARAGEIVTREELRRRLWNDNTFVDFDHSLNICVNKLREALGDSAENPRFVETLPRRGYRFVCPVQAVPVSEPAEAAFPQSVPAPATTPRVEVEGGWTRLLNRIPAWSLALAVLLVVAGTYFGVMRGQVRGAAGAGRMMLAVLPFENLSKNQDEEYFIAGLNEELIARMTRIRPSQLAVIGPASARQYMRVSKTMEEVARELGADYILAGSVQRFHERVRISVRLLRTSNSTYLWGETYDRNLSDIFDLQSEVASHVAESLRIELLPAAREAMDRPEPGNMEAYEAYLFGRYQLSRRRADSFEKAIASFQRSLQKDPTYPPAYAGLADSYNLLGGYNLLPPEDAFPRAKQSALKALELDPALAPAYASLGFTSFHYDWDWAAADRQFRRALELDPNYAPARQWYVEFLNARGRFDEAETQIRLAREKDPLALVLCDIAGWTYLSQNDFPRALEQFQRAHDIDPMWPKAYYSMSFAYARSGQFQKAREEINAVRKLVGDAVPVREYTAYIDALSGEKQKARENLRWMEKQPGSNRVSLYSRALIHVQLGEKKQALDLLEKALDEHDNWVIWLRALPEWKPLESEPRFQEILRRAGL